MSRETKAERRRRLGTMLLGLKAATATAIANGEIPATEVETITRLERRLDTEDRVHKLNLLARRLEAPAADRPSEHGTSADTDRAG